MAEINDEFYSELIQQIRDCESLIITTHINADMDALASCLGLKEFIRLIEPSIEVHIVIPQSSAFVSRILQEYELADQIENEWPTEIDLLVIVDTNDLLVTELPRDDSQTITFNFKRAIIIDHHLEREISDLRVVAKLILSNHESNVEIITEFFRKMSFSPDPAIAKIMIMGILTDTGYFRYGNNRSVDNMNYLLNLGVEMREINQKMLNPIPRSEKIARLKAALRMGDLHYIGDYIIVFSYVSSFEASASKALIDLGADLSFVIVMEKKNHFRLSARATESLFSNTTFHLGEFLTQIGPLFNGSGGGHDGAAGCYGFAQTSDYVTEISNIILEKLMEFFNTQKE